ncbi:SDR family oxidoreductase [Companilactobacillus musae]|uniref:SDR family oxidoreductase n=1 Tax=Companilactobacillus musae TaxID=1903258 RepID=UPI000E658948|nr:SDR family oxidoreductase [Companilactobacillus musae]
MNQLKNKVAIITGASSGFGLGTAYKFASEGCNLIITARNETKLKEVADKCQQMGNQTFYYAGDARDEKTAKAVISLAINKFHKIDILINNAGIGKLLSIEETSVKDFELIMDTNVKSAFCFTKCAVPEMKKAHSGQIIMTSSVTGIKGHADETAYTCSKFAIRGLGQALDQELLDYGIKTCVFCPHAGATNFEVGFGRTSKEVAQSDFLTPEDVASALLSVCVQPKHSRIVELRLASNNVKY